MLIAESYKRIDERNGWKTLLVAAGGGERDAVTVWHNEESRKV